MLPTFNCSAPWIAKTYSPSSPAGFVSDLRVVVSDIASGRPIHEQRCAPCNVEFACREHVLSHRQAEAAYGEGALSAGAPLATGGRVPSVELPVRAGPRATAS